jgi:cysteine-S-conjugate beta-lyase
MSTDNLLEIRTPAADTLRRRSGRKWSRFPPDVLPAWIADMDFLPAPVIHSTVMEALETGDLGYGPTGDRSGVPESFARWAERRWSWQLSPEAIIVMPDVVGGLANCIEALSEPSAAVLVHTPIYPPFMSTVRLAGRRLCTQDLIGGRIDFDSLRRRLCAEAEPVRLLLLCNPHNPTGRCFTRAELLELAALVIRHDLLVVSDEVHADLVLPGHTHIPFASLGPELAQRTVTLNAASKAFNIAGLRTAVCVCTDPALRGRLLALPSTRWNAFSTLGVRATLAAWTEDGEEWLNSCVTHLAVMRERISGWLCDTAPAVRCVLPEAGYLAWLDCRALALAVAPDRFFLERARVALSPGADFGDCGQGHVRLNFATSAQILDEILERMANACASLEQT